MKTPKKSDGLLQSSGSETHSVTKSAKSGYERLSDAASLMDKDSLCRLSYRGLNVSVGDKHILKNLNGDIEPGKMTCLLGASGAGKTTFLNLVSGRISGPPYTISGEFVCNGYKIDPKVFRKHTAYVMQEDAILATVTPREAINFSMALRTNYDGDERKLRTQKIIDSLKLNKCADSLIGNELIRGISGGEKKRTSIALDLVTKPSVLFLDEPTSGLDSYGAYNAMRIVKNLSRQGCSVVSTLHQPSSEIFHLFDNVIVLHEGEFIYNGSVTELDSYLESVGYPCPKGYNISDHMIFVVQTAEDEEIKRLIQHWRDYVVLKDFEQGVPLQDDLETGKPFFTQLYWTTYRQLLDEFRDKAGLFVGVFISAFLSLLFGFIFTGIGNKNETPSDITSHAGALTQIAISAMMGAVQPVLLTFQFRRPVFIREYSAGYYGVTPYFFSKFAVEIPKTAILCIITVTPAYFIMKLKSDYWILVACVYATQMSSTGIALFLGCVAPNVQAALSLAPLVFVPQMLFSGFFVGLKQIPYWLQWCPYLCGLKYSLGLMLMEEFHDQPGKEFVYERFDLHYDQVWNSIYILIALTVVFRLLSGVALKRLATRY